MFWDCGGGGVDGTGVPVGLVDARAMRNVRCA